MVSRAELLSRERTDSNAGLVPSAPLPAAAPQQPNRPPAHATTRPMPVHGLGRCGHRSAHQISSISASHTPASGFDVAGRTPTSRLGSSPSTPPVLVRASHVRRLYCRGSATRAVKFVLRDTSSILPITGKIEEDEKRKESGR